MNPANLLCNLLFPKKCIFCGCSMPINSENDWCEKCVDKLMIKTDRVCEVCGMPLKNPRGEAICQTCRSKKRSFIKNISPFVYKDKVRSALVRMKFSNNHQWIACAFGKLLANYISSRYSDIKFDGVAYVPISFRREISRGYNQSELMAEEIAKTLNIPFLKGALKKVKNNQKQSTLNAKQRESNVKGVYAPGKTSVEDKTILLIDDIYTTGSTINECASVLKKSGAILVYCATAAVTEGGKRFCVSKKNLAKLKR